MIPELETFFIEICSDPTEVTNLTDLQRIVQQLTPQEQYIAWHLMMGYSLEETRRRTNTTIAAIVRVRKSLRQWQP